MNPILLIKYFRILDSTACNKRFLLGGCTLRGRRGYHKYVSNYRGIYPAVNQTKKH